MSEIEFDAAFADLTGNRPFPWQWELYDKWFRNGKFPPSCNLPTGLGKTSVVAIWLIALANHPDKMPRRLVYVVNRRTVVDQTTNEVEKLRKNMPKLNSGLGTLALSTLRGQFADNREWSADPSRPAVICGTVDMIGSRLLFSGYGCGFKSRPLHAGFLGQDVLLVHDEAHLEPAFQHLVKAIENEQERCKEFRQERCKEFRPFRVVELTATSRSEGLVFELTLQEKAVPAELPAKPSEPVHYVWQRMRSKKGLKFEPAKRDSVATRIGDLARDQWKESGKAILAFVRTIEDVKEVKAVLTDKKKGGVPESHVQQLTGTMRGFERDTLASTDDVFARFCPAPRVAGQDGTVYLVCTSAGEVGVDISADHMVCDLSTLDSMAQRFGRVNRRGEGAAMIDVVFETDPNPKPSSPAFEAARWEAKKVLERLPSCDWTAGRHDASPAALGEVMKSLTEAERKGAFAPPPTILPVTDILFDAWALTTIRDKLPGRPPVAPYLHGISEWEPPQTQVAWREEVWELRREFEDHRERKQFQKYAAELLDDYPLKAHELLKERSDRVFNALKKLPAAPETPIWLLDDEGAVEVTTLGELVEGEKGTLDYKTVLLPPQAGGLEKGLLNSTAKYDPARTDYDVADEWHDNDGPLRKRKWDDDTKPTGMKLERIIPIRDSDDEDAEPTKIWYWFVRSNASDNPNARSGHAYGLEPHLKDAGTAAEQFVKRLALDADICGAVILAAKFHDLGKDRKLWQQGIGNQEYPAQKWAKSGGRMAATERSTYRHEFGSLLDVTERPEFLALTPDMQELVLHLIAAHHGRGRPHFPEDETFDHEPKDRDVPGTAAAVPGRYAKLQRKYGRWGLAYLESLVRAADILASRKAEEGDS